jgi:PIN domain nuclease of toxin-antitoxin system
MRLLLDTHILLWIADDSPRLSKKARALIVDPANEKFFSVASIWEVSIKSALRRDDFVFDATKLRAGLLARPFVELPVSGTHALATLRLPAIHKDLFDRMLVAQSLEETLTLLTADAVVASYSAAILRV